MSPPCQLTDETEVMPAALHESEKLDGVQQSYLASSGESRNTKNKKHTNEAKIKLRAGERAPLVMLQHMDTKGFLVPVSLSRQISKLTIPLKLTSMLEQTQNL